MAMRNTRLCCIFAWVLLYWHTEEMTAGAVKINNSLMPAQFHDTSNWKIKLMTDPQKHFSNIHKNCKQWSESIILLNFWYKVIANKLLICLNSLGFPNPKYRICLKYRICHLFCFAKNLLDFHRVCDFFYLYYSIFFNIFTDFNYSCKL